MPSKSRLPAHSCLRVHGEPVIGRRGGRTRLAERISGVETEVINVGVTTDDSGNAWIEKRFARIGVRALIILTRAERLTPEHIARMAGGDAAGCIRLLGDVAPNAQRKRRHSIYRVLQPGTPKMDVHNGSGVGALEIVGQHHKLAGVYVQSAGHVRSLDKFD